jgi:ClpP class serine protease
MQIAYPHIAERLFGRVHAIEPVALRAIMDGPIAQRVLAGDKVGSGKIKKNGRDLRRSRLSAIASAQQIREADGLIEFALTPEGVAIVPVAGVLARRFDWLAAACGWTTYEGLSATLDFLVQSFQVRAILLDVDTPGGEAAGMLDAADAILALRGQKPIWAVANVCAASAGYALAGGADKLVMPRLAIVGSIGCMMVHVDQSVRDAVGGCAYTAIYSGARKMDGWAHAPLSSEAQKVAQAAVDHVRDEFCNLIGRQGRMSAKQALATEAGVFSDNDAVKAGLADAVMTFDEALAQLTAQITEAPMGTKAALNSTTSPAAVAAAQNPAAAAAAVVDPAAGTAAAPAAAKVDAVPPIPGEKCSLCGQVMPEDDDGTEQETRSHPVSPATAALAAAATAPATDGYTTEHATKTVELCAIARLPHLAAAFVKAKTPLKKVRADLLRRSTEAAAEDVDTARPADPAAEQKAATMWDDVVGKLNAENAKNSAPRQRR